MLGEKGARAEESLLVIIDFQEKLFPSVDEKYRKSILEKLPKLIESAKILGIPVIYTEQYPRGLGHTITDISSKLKGKPIEKTSFSCFGSSEFTDRVVESAARYLIIAGIETHICVNQTVFDALGMGYTPIIVEDCSGSRGTSDHETAIRKMENNGVIVESSEMIIYEWLESAGNRNFKKVLDVVKG